MHVKIDVNDSFKQRILCFLNIFQTTDLIVIADTANCKLIKLNYSNKKCFSYINWNENKVNPKEEVMNKYKNNNYDFIKTNNDNSSIRNLSCYKNVLISNCNDEFTVDSLQEEKVITINNSDLNISIDNNKINDNGMLILLCSNSNIKLLNNMNNIELTIQVDNSELRMKAISNSKFNLISNNSVIKITNMENSEFNIYSYNDDITINNIDVLKNNSLLKIKEAKSNNNFYITLKTLLLSNIYYTKTAKFEKPSFLDREGYSFCPTLVIDSDKEYSKSSFISNTDLKRSIKKILLSAFGVIGFLLIIDYQNNYKDKLSTNEKYTYLKYTQVKLFNLFNNSN